MQQVSALNQTAARDLTLIQWRNLHLRLGLAAATIPLIFIAPSILNRTSQLHIMGRIITPVVAVIAGGVILKTAEEIETLEPLIETIHNQKLALLKHGLNTEVYQQTKFNALNAGKSVLELTESLEPPQTAKVTAEPTPEEPPSSKEYRDSEPNGNQLSVTDGTTDISQQELDIVSRALDEGFSDSAIVKEILGYVGRKFDKGKERLAAIKKQLGVES